jgi:hypothetical protein
VYTLFVVVMVVSVGTPAHEATTSPSRAMAAGEEGWGMAPPDGSLEREVSDVRGCTGPTLAILHGLRKGVVVSEVRWTDRRPVR